MDAHDGGTVSTVSVLTRKTKDSLLNDRRLRPRARRECGNAGHNSRLALPARNLLRCGGIGRFTGLGNFLFVVNGEEQKAAKGVMAVIAPASE